MLTENDVAKIRRLFQRVTQLESMLSQQSFNAYTGSPAFLVKAPAGGIPGRSGNTPGYAVCNMVRLFSNDAPQDKELAQMDTVQPVRNLGEAVDPDEVVVAHRDGFGDFFIGVAGSSSLVRFILKEDVDRCGEGLAELIDPNCETSEEITVVDIIGLCELAFNEDADPFAPENSMGFARLLTPGSEISSGSTTQTILPRYEILSIALGCCETDEPPCPQIPGVPMEAIPEVSSIDDIEYVIGFDEDGCLVKVKVGVCCEEEEDSSSEGPEPVEEPPEGPPLEEDEEEE